MVSIGLLSIAIVIVALGGAYYFKTSLPTEEYFDGENLVWRRENLTEIEKKRWSEDQLTFPCSKPMPVVQYDPKIHGETIANSLNKLHEPFVIKGSPPTFQWVAFKTWQNAEYVSQHLSNIVVHAPSDSEVRTHIPGEYQPLSLLPDITWKKPWRVLKILVFVHVFKCFCFSCQEEMVSTSVLFENPRKLAYFMKPVQILGKFIEDILPFNFLQKSWDMPDEINLWMGTPTVTTPAHYDLM